MGNALAAAARPELEGGYVPDDRRVDTLASHEGEPVMQM